MCGIFGYITQDRRRVHVDRIINSLFTFSETRGKEASGLIALNSNEINYIKDAIPASELIKREDYKIQVKDSILKKDETIAFVGHSRLVTNGSSEINENNQPVYVNGCIGVHNGIITNEADLWDESDEIQKTLDLDSEIIFSLLGNKLEHDVLNNIIPEIFSVIEGVANIAAFFDRYDIAMMATNNGSLYYLVSADSKSILFASERFILEKVIEKNRVSFLYNKSDIRHLEPNSYVLVDLSNLGVTEVLFKSCHKDNAASYPSRRRVVNDKSKLNSVASSEANLPFEVFSSRYSEYERTYEKNKRYINDLVRCSKCLLPETMPFIKFDENGLCNYCAHYTKHQLKGVKALKRVVSKQSGDFDCLVTLSGGRDSSYGIHYIRNELGLNPVTYTYDWGMVTDLARRNQMRMCGKLGVEHILVSADIVKKRKNIRKNVSAWLKNPQLGMVPLFMAGDKQYFYWSHKIAEQTNCKTIILCENLLETTRFKSGFCGIRPLHGTSHTYSLSLRNKFQMSFYYWKNFLKTPGYLNSSLLDTLSAFSSYYIMQHNFVNLFDYIDWNEEKINSILIDTYNWETSPDTVSTWRIGDGTASFYNYIYYTIAGMTENDTFRSNQIREGQISREEAAALSIEENRPRFESMAWYLNTIGLDFGDTLKIINGASKLYYAG